MSIFRIQIKPGYKATFDPSPLTAFENDSVFWFNADPENAHWPAPSKSDPTGFIPYQIPPNNSSTSVAFGTATKDPINYICINHEGESGQIIIKPGKKAAFARKTKKGAFGGKTKKGAFGNITK